MKTCITIFLLLTTITSCSELKLKKSKNRHKRETPYHQLEKLINNEDFKEARKLFKKYGKNRFGWRGDKVIDYSEKHLPEINKCSHKITKFTQAQTYKCLKILDLINDKYLTRKHKSLVKNSRNKLIDHKEYIQQKNISDLHNICEKQSTWGYLVLSKQLAYQAFSYKKDLSKLIGKYKSESLCNEKRLLSKKATSDKCYKRFTGENRYQIFYFAEYMINNKKDKLFFKSQQKCNNSINQGLIYSFETGSGYSSQIHSLEIGKKGGVTDTRFITKCYETKRKICENGTKGANIPLKLVH